MELHNAAYAGNNASNNRKIGKYCVQWDFRFIGKSYQLLNPEWIK